MNYFGNDTLYHYTSAAGMGGILSTHSLWLSDLRSLNDERELIFGQETFFPRICEWVECNFTGPARNYLLLLLRERFSFDALHNGFFSASFCPASDNTHLWKHYGANGTGAAIGFHHMAIGMMANLQTVQYPSTTIQEFTDGSLALFDQQFGWLKGQKAPGPFFLAASRFILALMALYVSSKEQKWAEEREVRAVWAQTKPGFRQFPEDSLQANGVRKYFPISHRASPFGEVEYIVRDFSAAIPGISPIREIVLGPACVTDIPELTAAIAGWGYPDIAVRRSSIDNALL